MRLSTRSCTSIKSKRSSVSCSELKGVNPVFRSLLKNNLYYDPENFTSEQSKRLNTESVDALPIRDSKDASENEISNLSVLL